MTTQADNAAAALARLSNLVDAHRGRLIEISRAEAPIPPGTNPLDRELIGGIRANHEMEKVRLAAEEADRFKRSAWGEVKQAAESVLQADRKARAELAKATRDRRSAVSEEDVRKAAREVRAGLADHNIGGSVAERARAILDRAERADDAPLIAALRDEAMQALESTVGGSVGGTEGVAALDALTRLRSVTLPGEQAVADAEAVLQAVEDRQSELFVLVHDAAKDAGGNGSVWAGELGVQNLRRRPTPAENGGAFVADGESLEPNAIISTELLPSYVESR